MKRVVPLKNYVYLVLIMIGVGSVLLYFVMHHKNSYEESINISIIGSSIGEIRLNEFDDYIGDKRNSLVYIAVPSDDMTRKFEKNFKLFVEEYSLDDNMVLLNMLEYKENTTSKLKEKFSYYDDEISFALPLIGVFYDGKLIDVLNIKGTSTVEVERFLTEYEYIE